MIHPTAVIDPRARLDPAADVGPYAVIEGAVEVGPGCRIGPHVVLRGPATIGAENRFHPGAVIGDDPQDLKYSGGPTRLQIGDRNVFREHVTVHRSNRPEEATVIGSDNYFMAGSHVGHNARVGDRVILANGAMLGGHAEVEDRAFLSGTSMVHQFARVGMLAIMQGGAGISQDLPPYCIGVGVNQMCGLNIIGLRRAGISPEARLELKRLYHELFRSGRSPREVLRALPQDSLGEPARRLCAFVLAAKKGVCSDLGGAAAGEGERPAD